MVAIWKITLSAAVIALNVFATYKVIRSEELERFQIAAQIAIVWLFPLLGASVILIFHRSANEKVGANPKGRAETGIDNYTVGGGD